MAGSGTQSAGRKVWGNLIVRHTLLAIIGFIIAVVLIVSVSEFRATQLASFAYLGTAVAGLTVLTGLNGQLSLGHGAFMAIGAYTVALGLQDGDGSLPLPILLVGATIVAALVGVVVGVAAARLHGPYLAGATLALAVAVPGLAIYFGDTLGGEQGLNVRVPDVPAWLADAVYFVFAVDPSRGRFVAILAWAVLVAVLFLLANLSASRVGRTWRAVRDDEVAAELAGIDVARSRVLAFVISAACAGMAGGLMALVVRIAAPSGFTLTLSLTLVAAVVLGGLGSLTGAMIGAALLTFLPQVATEVGGSVGFDDVQSAELAPLVYGLVLVIVVLVAPGGLMGVVRNLRNRFGGGAPAVATSTESPATATPSSSPARPQKSSTQQTSTERETS